MQEIKVFENEEFGAVRTVEIDGNPYFVGKDVANILGYQNGSRDVNRHVDEEWRLKFQAGVSKMDIPENKAEAEKPQKWMGGVAA